MSSVSIVQENALLILPKEAFDALVSMVRNKHTGSILIEYKQGGIAGVKKTIVCK